MRMNAKTENKANFRANEPSVMIGRFQPHFHKVKLEWNDREKVKGKRFAQNCAVSSLRETLASEANGFLVCSSFVFQKVEVSLCVFPLALPLSFSSWPSSSLFARAFVSGFYTDYKQKTYEKNRLLRGVEKQKNTKRRLRKILNVTQEVETRIELNKKYYLKEKIPAQELRSKADFVDDIIESREIS